MGSLRLQILDLQRIYMYGTNYFRRRNSETGSEEKVPIKWMAPESIENSIYTEASDVVSIPLL